MSQPSPAGFRVEIAPKGDAVLRGADGRHPEGYLPLGRSWAIREGSTLHDKWTRYEAASTSENKDEAAEELALAKLKSAWNQLLASLIPDLTRLPPVSVAGLPRRGRILAPVQQEAGRKAQIEALTLNAWIIMTSWVRFLCTAGASPDNLSQDMLRRGIYQVLALEAGYVTEGCREAVAALQARLFVPLEQVVPPLG